MRLQSYNTFDTPAGKIVAVLASAYLLFEISKSVYFIVTEIRFYCKNDWDFDHDSKNPCWMQQEMKRFLGYLPIGQMKLLVESLWVALRTLFIFL